MRYSRLDGDTVEQLGVVRVAGTDDSDSLRSSGLSVEPSYRSISGAGAMCTV